MGWRVLFIVTFLPLALPWGACTFAQMVVAGLSWLIFGPNEGRTERLILAAPASWFAKPLDYLSGRAKL